jgi:CubicO group peptidase (beta-lactamase class C family)
VTPADRLGQRVERSQGLRYRAPMAHDESETVESPRKLRESAVFLVARLGVAALLAVLSSCAHGGAGAPAVLAQASASPSQVFPAADWVRVASPEDLGWSSQKLAIARVFSEGLGSDSVMIVQGGVVVDAWGDPTRKVWTASMRKSLLSALIGRAVADGTIQLDETLGQLGIDDDPPLTAEEKEATVRDLLRARSGVYLNSALEDPGWTRLRPPRGSHPHGTFWHYNNWDFNMLRIIYEQKTGLTVGPAFATQIAQPLEMQDYTAADGAHYPHEPKSSKYDAYGFTMSARDLARFGLLYLRNGEWRGQQVVPSEWVALSSHATESVGRHGGYEYNWWVEFDHQHFDSVDLGGGAFSAQGSGAQYLVVIPADNLVVVHRGREKTNITIDQFGQLLRRILDAAPPVER